MTTSIEFDKLQQMPARDATTARSKLKGIGSKEGSATTKGGFVSKQ
jgi:hypothetical protein